MSTHEFTTGLSFLPLQYQDAPLRMGLDAEGNIICIATDLVKALGYRDPANALRLLDDDEQGYSNLSTLRGLQRVLYVTESGFYHLIFGSRRPEAKEFRRWVTREVLPTLRRTGTYTIPESIPAAQSTLTARGYLPPVPPRIKEHAKVSWHLAAVWALLRDSGEVLTNHEIAQRTGIAPRTARAHTQYLLYLGLLDLDETFPRYLYRLAETAAQRNAGCYHRLNRLTAQIQARQAF